MPERRLLTAFAPPPSPMARPGERRPPFRIGLVQEFWRPDPDEHQAALAAGARQAVAAGARLVCLQ
ncbi:MAG TPA: hypothetical protein VFI22_00430, partial [Thermomicrobiales bacterium]|nr:hypothetical protein [Thermomicrobiales bacterium]